jgi:hypothetical protein
MVLWQETNLKTNIVQYSIIHNLIRNFMFCPKFRILNFMLLRCTIHHLGPVANSREASHREVRFRDVRGGGGGLTPIVITKEYFQQLRLEITFPEVAAS